MTDYSTHGVKYIGSKKTLLPYIGEFVDQLGDVETAIDVFAGTTRVAQYLRQKGVKTTTSDLSWATSCYAGAFVHNGDNAHLAPHIAAMNALAGEDGWLTENYTGAGSTDEKADGRCFQAKNTRRADAARDYIETLSLEPWECYADHIGDPGARCRR
jgi:adenine-specific DNA methylase